MALPSDVTAETDEQGLAVLAAACDIAVLRALELVGKRVGRMSRERDALVRNAMRKSGRDWSEAHTIWRAEPGQVDAALVGAWSALPRRHGCCSLATRALHDTLDAYVRDLVSAQRPHSFEEMEARLRATVAAQNGE